MASTGPLVPVGISCCAGGRRCSWVIERDSGTQYMTIDTAEPMADSLQPAEAGTSVPILTRSKTDTFPDVVAGGGGRIQTPPRRVAAGRLLPCTRCGCTLSGGTEAIAGRVFAQAVRNPQSTKRSGCGGREKSVLRLMVRTGRNQRSPRTLR